MHYEGLALCRRFVFTAFGIQPGLQGRGIQPEHIISPNVAIVTLKACAHHPALRMFSSNVDARQLATMLGSPWLPFAFGGGYMLTNGWHFRDADGHVKVFCLVPHQMLASLQALVRVLQTGHYPAHDYPKIILGYLRSFPALQQLPRSDFDGVCLCTLMRLGHPTPCDAPDDWLTIPSWGSALEEQEPSAVVAGVTVPPALPLMAAR